MFEMDGEKVKRNTSAYIECNKKNKREKVQCSLATQSSSHRRKDRGLVDVRSAPVPQYTHSIQLIHILAHALVHSLTVASVAHTYCVMGKIDICVFPLLRTAVYTVQRIYG